MTDLLDAPEVDVAASSTNGTGPTVLPEPDDTERMSRQGNPRQGVVEIITNRLERVLQPVDDPKPVDWLADPEYDRLRWAIARAQGRPGGSTTEDEDLGAKILDELEAIQSASDTPVWPGVTVITRRDFLEAMVLPLPPTSSQAASVTTPAFIYVDAVCPVCGIATEISLEVGVKLVAEGYSRKLQLVPKAKDLPHQCGQMRIRDVTPTKPVKGQTAIDFGAETDQADGPNPDADDGAEPTYDGDVDAQAEADAVHALAMTPAREPIPTCDFDTGDGLCSRPSEHEGDHDAFGLPF